MTASLPRENVEHYPRPPALEPVSARIVIRHGGARLADSIRALRVLETFHAPTYYIPPEDIRVPLRPAPGQSFCEWKGAARYFDLLTDATTLPRAAWCYDRPTARYTALAGFIAVYAGAVDAAWVGDVRVIPQPGDFYGGWVTPNLDGRIKGAPGTRHW